MQDEIVYTQSSQLPESMQQEVDSALALCRATLERCTAQHAAIGGASENHRVLPTKAHRDHAGTNVAACAIGTARNSGGLHLDFR